MKTPIELYSYIKPLGSFPCILILITSIVFIPTFSNDFQRAWDDQWQLLENPFVLEHSFENILYHFTDFYHGQYSPINTLVYIAIYKLFGLNATAFHFVFLLVHILNVLLVFNLISTIVKLIKPTYSSKHVKYYALFVGLIFAIHPLQVESVAWISASKVVLYTFFFLTAIWSYLKYIQSNKISWLFAVAVLYILSFGSKEQAIILPLNLVLLDVFLGRFKTIHWNWLLFKNKIILEKIPFFGLAVCFWYFSSLFNLGNLTVDNSYPLYQRLLMGMHSMVEYVFRTIAPVKLYYYYYFPIKVGEELPLYYWGYVLLTIIIVAFIWLNYKRNNKLVVFGFLFFIVNILLVLHIIPTPRKMITADRYMYVSIIGLALLGGWLINYIYIKYPKYKKIGLSVLTLYFFSLGIQSYFRTQEWKDSATMKKNVTELIEKRKAQNKPLINNPLKLKKDE